MSNELFNVYKKTRSKLKATEITENTVDSLTFEIGKSPELIIKFTYTVSAVGKAYLKMQIIEQTDNFKATFKSKESHRYFQIISQSNLDKPFTIETNNKHILLGNNFIRLKGTGSNNHTQYKVYADISALKEYFKKVLLALDFWSINYLNIDTFLVEDPKVVAPTEKIESKPIEVKITEPVKEKIMVSTNKTVTPANIGHQNILYASFIKGFSKKFTQVGITPPFASAITLALGDKLTAYFCIVESKVESQPGYRLYMEILHQTDKFKILNNKMHEYFMDAYLEVGKSYNGLPDLSITKKCVKLLGENNVIPRNFAYSEIRENWYDINTFFYYVLDSLYKWSINWVGFKNEEEINEPVLEENKDLATEQDIDKLSDSKDLPVEEPILTNISKKVDRTKLITDEEGNLFIKNKDGQTFKIKTGTEKPKPEHKFSSIDDAFDDLGKDLIELLTNFKSKVVQILKQSEDEKNRVLVKVKDMQFAIKSLLD